MAFDPDSFEAQVTGSLSRIEKTIEVLPDHEKRLRVMERVLYGLYGAWAVVSTWLGIHIHSGK